MTFEEYEAKAQAIGESGLPITDRARMGDELRTQWLTELHAQQVANWQLLESRGINKVYINRIIAGK